MLAVRCWSCLRCNKVLLPGLRKGARGRKCAGHLSGFGRGGGEAAFIVEARALWKGER